MRTPVLRPMAPTVKDLLACLEEMCPSAWALPEDRVGLQVGDPGWPAATVLVALEVSPAVVAEALALKAQVLLTHHPLIFQAAADIREDRAPGRLLARVVRAGLAVASCHTNLDMAPEGLNDHLAGILGLEDLEVLSPVRQDSLVKLTVFVPLGYEDRVREALVDDRVGVIGRYAKCSFAGRGQGTYFPLEGARPFRSEAGALARTPESRLEVLAPESRVPAALARLRAVHPYEEVACDLYPLANRGLTLGFGRVGRWPESLSWEEALARVKGAFGVERLRVWGRPPVQVSRVAVCGGSGGDLITRAQERGAQVYVTGEVRHHQAVPGLAADFAILEVGHFASEVVFMPAWAEQVSRALLERGLEAQVRAAAQETPPFYIF